MTLAHLDGQRCQRPDHEEERQERHGQLLAVRQVRARTNLRLARRLPPPPPLPPPPALTVAAEPYFSQNQTLAAFLIARGASAMLELPVCGAFEAMSDYDLTNPLLDVEFGRALGAGERVAPGRFRREYAKATVELDCKSWSSTFTLKDG